MLPDNAQSAARARPDDEISYAQFKALANSIPNLAWMADPEGWIFWYNQRWYDYTGTTPDEMLGWGWQSVHHPNILPEMLQRWTRALATGDPFEMTFPLRRGSDGSFRMFMTRAEPLREGGRLVGWFGTNTDITEQEQTRERLQLVINELNHRVKNTLATVQSLAANSFRRSDPNAYLTFEQRLMALSGVHDLLTKGSWSTTSLHDLVTQAVFTFETDRFDIEGPEARVDPGVASALAITLHELCTNALKYGALSNQQGRVGVRWALEAVPAGQRLEIGWTERGGPRVTPPQKDGFGLKLIRRATAVERGSSVSHEFPPEGATCRIVIALKATHL